MEQTHVERSGGGGGEGKEEKGRERRVTGSWEESALRLSGSARASARGLAALLVYDTARPQSSFSFLPSLSKIQLQRSFPLLVKEVEKKRLIAPCLLYSHIGFHPVCLWLSAW